MGMSVNDLGTACRIDNEQDFLYEIPALVGLRFLRIWDMYIRGVGMCWGFAFCFPSLIC